MKKLTSKWKFFLFINYFLLIINSLSILGTSVTLIESNPNEQGTGPVIVFLIIFIFITLISILNIYIINRYFPDKILSKKANRIFTIGRITMIIFTVLVGLIVGLGIYILFTESSEREKWTTIAGIIFFGLFFILCLYMSILQFQIPGYLTQQGNNNINKLIDSIGT
jgi:uncharacterized membrane protein